MKTKLIKLNQKYKQKNKTKMSLYWVCVHLWSWFWLQELPDMTGIKKVI